MKFLYVELEKTVFQWKNSQWLKTVSPLFSVLNDEIEKNKSVGRRFNFIGRIFTLLTFIYIRTSCLDIFFGASGETKKRQWNPRTRHEITISGQSQWCDIFISIPEMRMRYFSVYPGIQYSIPNPRINWKISHSHSNSHGYCTFCLQQFPIAELHLYLVEATYKQIDSDIRLSATAKELCAVNHQNSDNDETSLPRLFYLCRYGYCPCFCKRCNSSKSTQRRHSFVYCPEWYVSSHEYVEGVIFVTRYNDDDGD